LTVDGVPYAKTDCVGFLVDTQNRFDYKCLSDRFSIMASKLMKTLRSTEMKESKTQKKVHKVMSEFKDRTLHSGKRWTGG